MLCFNKVEYNVLTKHHIVIIMHKLTEAHCHIEFGSAGCLEVRDNLTTILSSGTILYVNNLS